ncbi:sodium/hydrogen exchanger [Nitritalea halalkaliphila LW7]|uniref:Sodium/hydrogen exchanger n=1 Tax=Nitritalea halalkaliphila LW7 TaxID=1189621 RepID=I5C9L1_9BACT|nr:cation:proton antiporter [Nitritalea halalkaliphila]EIM78513.1 sodium/hydrogen exchanger [Nitritalea halalkaliphila LW7]
MLGFMLAAAELPILSDLVIIFGLATGVILLFTRFKLPTIIGFLLTGTLAGPFGLSLVNDSTVVETLSEIGVILLLFVIGMEFSLKNLFSIRKAVLLGGGLQVVLTIAATAVLANFLGFDWNIAVFLGFLFALSSTAIVLKLLQETGEMATIPGRTTLAILIFQDIIIVPMMLLTPMLAGQADNVGLEITLMLVKGVAVIALTIVTARYIMPAILFRIVKTRNEELFLLSIIVICFAVAYFTSLLGLSIGLGAFLAGLIISESDYSHHATGLVLPFREIFLSFFFVSVGMLFDIQFLFENFGLILAFTLATFVIKFLIISLSVKSIGQGAKSAFMVGFSIFQIGEFSLLLAKEGVRFSLLDDITYQYFLAISILTMAITPFVLKAREALACRLLAMPLPKRLNNRLHKDTNTLPTTEIETLRDHLVIIGYGLNGRNLAKAAKSANIPYAIIEMNPETVKEEGAKGEPILYGDAANSVVLEHVHAGQARVIVIAISNAEATKRIVAQIRMMSSNPTVIVRTRYINEIEENINLGANEVIPEEFETSIEIFNRVLNKYLVPRHDIEAFTREVRSHNYDMFRSVDPAGDIKFQMELPAVNFVSIAVERDNGAFIDKALKDTHIRQKTGVNIVAIKRGTNTITEISGNDKLKLGDVVYAVGKNENLEKLAKELEVD